MAVEESDHGTFTCTIHDFHATAAMDPENPDEAMVPTGAGYDPSCPDCRDARRRAAEHATGERPREH